jgi:hypothetical protein
VDVTIELPPLASPVDQLWHVLLDLGESLEVPWTLVGGQMVLLHALEHGQVPPQISQDGDVVADIRTVSDALTRVVAALEEVGFDLESMSTDPSARCRDWSAAEAFPSSSDRLSQPWRRCACRHWSSRGRLTSWTGDAFRRRPDPRQNVVHACQLCHPLSYAPR